MISIYFTDSYVADFLGRCDRHIYSPQIGSSWQQNTDTTKVQLGEPTSFIRVTDGNMGEELLTGAEMTIRTIPFARPLYIPYWWPPRPGKTFITTIIFFLTRIFKLINVKKVAPRHLGVREPNPSPSDFKLVFISCQVATCSSIHTKAQRQRRGNPLRKLQARLLLVHRPTERHGRKPLHFPPPCLSS